VRDSAGLLNCCGDDRYRSDRAVEEREFREDFYTALSMLDVNRRAVFVLYEIEGKSLEEITHIVAKPLGTVKSRLFRARRDLQKLLSNYAGDVV
jgi:RNA polymerase sigma-70 factor (ECF subfamily)